MAPAIATISGSGGITPTGTINITENGTHNVTNYASANVSVSNSYSSSDEGKVVSNGALVVQSSATYTENGTYDTTLKNSVTVDVEGGGSSTEVVSVVDTIDTAGGTIRTITALDISDTTATAEDVASGKYFYTAAGTKTQGTATIGGDDAYKFIDGSLSGEYINNLISSIRNYALNFHTGHDFSFSSSSATSIGYNAFQGANITSFSAPNLTGAANNASTFNSAKKLTFADMGSLSKIYSNFAWNANALTVLVLRHTSVVVLDNVNAFGNTPIRGYNGLSGTIYVPSDLISSYKTASNWSSIFNEGHVTFTAIEGSVYE